MLAKTWIIPESFYFHLFQKPCLDQGACATSEESTRISKSRKCRSDSDCIGNEYCHTFHRLCVKPVEVVTPVKTSVKRCSKDSDCRTAEYCHVFWRICLPSRRVHYRKPPTRRPSWYCYTSKDCKINEQCHGRFHSCYTRPGISTVRRNAGNSRRCETTSDCGENFYCHVHFRICLENVPAANKPSSKIRKQKTCSSKTPCPKGMLCHHFWSICYIPARVVTLPKRNKTEQCQIDSDCRPNEFCHFMVTSAGHLVARQRRSIQRICLPRRFQKIKKNKEVGTCKTAADCGPSRCCLKKLGVCMGYKLPGEMCLTEEVRKMISLGTFQ